MSPCLRHGGGRNAALGVTNDINWTAAHTCSTPVGVQFWCAIGSWYNTDRQGRRRRRLEQDMSLAVGLVLMAGLVTAGGEQLPDWCTTLERWEAKGLGSAAAGGCPTEGACDIPAVRDTYAPDASTPFKIIRVHVIVFREDDGSAPAATAQDVADQMDRMNGDFGEYRIYFVYTWEYVDNTLFRYNGNDTLMKLTHAVSPETRCNVYVTSLNGGYGTFAWDPSALTALGGIVVGGSVFGGNSSVMSHEMGHNLGLWHTHHGVSETTPCSACWEQADGLNGDTTGDFCGDTPPTPVDYDCVFPGGNDQCSGEPWAPTLPESYMSYGQPCWSMFTVHQASRMHCWVEAVLTGWLSPDLEPPGNDECAGAIPITGTITEFYTFGATTSAPSLPVECDEGGGLAFENDMWFTFTPDAPLVVLNLCLGPLTFDGRMAVYENTCGDLTLVDCSDDSCDLGPSVSFDGQCGQTYLVRVGGSGDVTGYGRLIAAAFGECVASCPWDLDDDGAVGINDFLDLLAAWDSNPGGPPDFDGNGNVGIEDFLELLANWGPCQ